MFLSPFAVLLHSTGYSVIQCVLSMLRVDIYTLEHLVAKCSLLRVMRIKAAYHEIEYFCTSLISIVKIKLIFFDCMVPTKADNLWVESYNYRVFIISNVVTGLIFPLLRYGLLEGSTWHSSADGVLGSNGSVRSSGGTCSIILCLLPSDFVI